MTKIGFDIGGILVEVHRDSDALSRLSRLS